MLTNSPRHDQIKVGDKLKLAYAEEMLIAVVESKDPVGAENAGLVGIAPKGAKPGGVMVETTNMTAKVVAVDPEKHHLTIQDADGKEKKMKISKKAKNLDTLKPGETMGRTLPIGNGLHVFFCWQPVSSGGGRRQGILH